MTSTSAHPLRRWLTGALVALAVLLGGGFAALHYTLARMPEYQARLQQLVRERTGLDIEFKRLDTSLRWYGPEVVFWGAVLRTADGEVLASARRGAVSLAWGRTLFERRVVIGRISLEGTEIGVARTPAGRIQVIGLWSDAADGPPDLSRLPEGRYRVRDARVKFVDEQHARAPWVLSKVALDVQRGRNTLDVDGSADLPEVMGRDLRFQLRLSGDLSRSVTWQTQANIVGDSLQLARWREVLAPEWIETLQGTVSLQLRSRWQGAHLQDLSVKLDARDVQASVPAWDLPIPAAAPLIINTGTPADATPAKPVTPAHKTLPTHVAYDRLRAEVDLQRLRNEWRLHIDNFALSEAAKPSQLEASWRPGDSGLESFAFQADHLALEPLWPLLAWLPESEALARLRALEVAGELHNVRVSYTQGGEHPSYQVQAQLRNLKFAPTGRIPGLAGISAAVEANEKEGALTLARGPLTFDWPSTFRDSLALDTVEGVLRWTRTNDGWLLESDGISLASPDGRVHARLQLAIPRDGSSPQIDLTADATDLDPRATSRYLPANLLRARTLAWLDRAFVAGRVPHAQLSLSGALRSFPFRHGGGELLVRAQVQDLAIDYGPQWMPATGIQANVEFRNAGMHAEVQAARIGGLTIERATADFEDFKQAELVLRGSAQGDVSEALRYLQSSPIGPSMGPLFMGLTGRGNATYTVAITLPFRDLTRRQVDVRTRLYNAWIDHEAVKKPVSHLTGSFRVVNERLHSGSLRGQWLGGPALIAIEPQDKHSLLEAKGALLATELAGLLRLPASMQLLGNSAWSGYVQLAPPAEVEGAFAHVDLELDDTTVALPAPLHKDAKDRRPLSADLELQETAAFIRAKYGSVRAVGRIAKDDAGWRFDRAGVRADGATPSLPPHPGVRLEGRVETLVLDDWFALRKPDAGDKRGLKVADLLRAANLEIGELGLFGYRWHDVRGLLQAQAQSWRVDLAAPHVAGHLQIPYELESDTVLTANLERLVLPARAASTTSSGSRIDPRTLPNVRAHVRRFALQDHGLGELNAQITRVAQGMRIDNLEIRGNSYEGEVKGSWLVTPAGELTQLDMLIASSDVRDTLQAFNYSPFMQAKHAEVKGHLSWPGGLDERWLARATGTISVHADQGQLLKVEPGAGRVLGLFSFSALPRRLSLDFTDLTGEGLSFDNIRGDFDIRGGNAYTSNLLVRGPATEIGLVGRTGLEAQDYDQTVVVTGKLGASLPVAGALAGGPAVAAAVLLFSRIFKEPLGGVTRGYRITGSWDEPVIERIQGSQAREAAEGTGVNATGAGT
jgi:uncharacterized protein (TIGR02099 family)